MQEYKIKKTSEQDIIKAYEYARERYASIGVDTDAAMEKLSHIPISIHCWQGDDVIGFENPTGSLSGGIQTTGNYPGKARTIDELRKDFEKALSLIPGNHKINLHAIYGDFSSGKADRDAIRPEHFASWMEWAKELGIGVDFNPTCFSHPLSEDGFTLSNKDARIRDFWVEHCIRCREIGEYFGKNLNQVCTNNIWIPDGCKDAPADMLAPRMRLEDSLNRILEKPISKEYNLDSVESKLFGIGSESYVVGSHEFYMGYAVKNDTLLTLDSGHFHPTEVISNKISSVLLFLKEILLHVSRPVRWDSDHVVALDDELRAIAQQLVRNDLISRTHIGLDYFDASKNRLVCWVTGTRNMLKALLAAYLEPYAAFQALENADDSTTFFALSEELKTYPLGAVWDYYCLTKGVPAASDWVSEVKNYEDTVLSNR